MASIILTQVGSVAGSSLAGAFGSVIGQAIGSLMGSHLDSKLFPATKRHSYGARYNDLMVQTATYGKAIANIYGMAAIAGNIIWSLPIRENPQVRNTKHGSHTDYNYSVSFAIAICKGPIDAISRIWVNDKLVDINFAKYRLYKGTQDQMPDHLIEAHQGIGKTPAYRGIAYIVLEDFSLAPYHNHIPNFIFEVKRTLHSSDNLEHMIKNMVMIPGSGEFVYDTVIQHKLYGMPTPSGRWIQRGMSVRINHNTHFDKADALVALDQLQETCPNLSWVAPVVTWFASDLDIAKCRIVPGVEYQDSVITTPDVWSVGGLLRDQAYLISRDVNNAPNYGGSVSDHAILRYLAELRNRGLKIMLYPMIFVDLPNKPWRGRISGNEKDVALFFRGENGYNNFILHYANLVKGKIDAFIIGSELIGLTRIKDDHHNFPAISELINLAKQVKEILGDQVKVTYGADWSEYHHTDGGWYNLDPLWASNDIDMVAIDAYFPLTNSSKIASQQEIIDGWESGEGYDFYYQNDEKIPLSKEYAWKNINWWWGNNHYNPDGNKTPWQPKSKKIWFTEFGFPSVDACSNQPNVFYDPASCESLFPKYSKGSIDFTSQHNAIYASISKWKNSEFLEEMFLWCWDARPYPFWPSLNKVWRDAKLWGYGHWVNGKLGCSSLRDIVANLCDISGLTKEQYDCSLLTGHVDGYIIADNSTARNAIETLAAVCFFQLIESQGKLKFIPLYNSCSGISIDQSELVIQDQQPSYKITKEQEINLPKKIEILFLDKVNNYRQATECASMGCAYSKEQISSSLPMVLSSNMANNLAKKMLYNYWQNNMSFNFVLSSKYSYLEPGDVVIININNTSYRVMISNICYGGAAHILQISAILADRMINDEQIDDVEVSKIDALYSSDDIIVHILDLAITRNNNILAAITCLGENFSGVDIYNSNDWGNTYQFSTHSKNQAVMGSVVNKLGRGEIEIIDYENMIEVMIISGELSSQDFKLMGNMALIGDEIIQFANAIMIGDNHYQLSGLIRGCYGSENYIDNHEEGERFILLDNNLVEIPSELNLEVEYKIGKEKLIFFYQGNNQKSWPVSHVNVTKNLSQDIEITWIRRSRICVYNWDMEVPLDEMLEQYEVDILKNNTIIRKINSTEPFITYSIDQILSDFGNYPDMFSFVIYQNSSIGRGFAKKINYIENNHDKR